MCACVDVCELMGEIEFEGIVNLMVYVKNLK